jgi:uncharacterized iron-regulated membrane protein
MKAAAGSSKKDGSWPGYATVWRWHFYAGLFCLPFVCWLSVTGIIYAFRPDIEAWLDRPYENLSFAGARQSPTAEVQAALGAIPGASLSHYEPPASSTGAAQIVVNSEGGPVRVYVHPRSLQIMKMEADDRRFVEVVSKLHGSLMMGNPGSIVVELAASWTIVMIVTGLFLWFPKSLRALGGVTYPRLSLRGRPFWRDLHAVIGLWVSIVTLFMLFSGLPWAKSWGTYFTWVRSVATGGPIIPDWKIGEDAPGKSGAESMAGMSAAQMAAMMPDMEMNLAQEGELGGLDAAVTMAGKLQLARPVWILPPPMPGHGWTIESEAQNRPLRVTYVTSVDGARIVNKSGFADKPVVDRVTETAVAAHEGQLFGRWNQAILVLNALGLIILSVGAVVMWWKRRPKGVLGAPRSPVSPAPIGVGLWLVIVAIGVVLPLFAASLLVLLSAERLLLPRLPRLATWLGSRYLPSR